MWSRLFLPSWRMLWVLVCVAGVIPTLVLAQGDDAPPPPEEVSTDLLDLSLDVGEGEQAGRDRDPEITVTWSPLKGHPDVAVVAIRVELQEGANTYSFEAVDGFTKPTKINITSLSGLTAIDEKFVSDHPPKIAPDPFFDGATRHKFFHEVTFLRRYRIPGENPPAVEGRLDILVCRKGCTPHKIGITADWSTDPYDGPIPESWKKETNDKGSSTPAPTDSSTPPAASEGSETSSFDVEQSAPLSFGYALGLAFLGGLIMNVMPCVLPVIAIKVLSFVQQAGESRSRIFALNLTYSLGVIVVFLGLATLATFAKIGLGQLFQYDGFNVAMACVVFAMGLSLLGVFEFKLPGSVGGSTEHEGLPGAFFTGILATLLATPCIGPFVSGVLVWSVTQPTAVIYLIWATLGLGMASPYLLIGLFPSLVNRMPRPGMWMVRFKEFSGFVLMATVIFLINSVSPDQLIPTLVILLGVALGLWMIGNLYDHSTPTSQKWKVRGYAFVMTFLLVGGGIYMQYGKEELPWEPFSESKLVELRKAGKPIIIDFTADWCAVCKTNEKLSLNTAKTAEFVKANNIVCLKADYTNESPEIDVWLKQRFKRAGVPLVVIFPPGKTSKGITFDSLFTQSRLLESMKTAWKSSTPSGTAAVPQANQTVLK